MSEIIDFISGVDDDYLIGLSNKGIVKRSYKDLESESYEVSEQGAELLGKNGDITVTLKMPLTNSECSCPSSSICKHVIMTILAAKAKFSQQTKAPSGNVGEPAVAESAGEEKPEQNTLEQERLEKEKLEKEKPEKEKLEKEKLEKEKLEKEKLAREKLLEIPLEELKKGISEKQWFQILSSMETRKECKITYGSMVTVQNPADGTTVKLSFPLTYATCSSCHDDKICVHKVFALLAMKLEAGRISLEELREMAGGDEDAVHESVPDVLESLMFFLEDLLKVGSARISPETPYGLERLAIRCHEAGLASLEEKLRNLSGKVSGYQGRKASVTAGTILLGITDCFCLVKQMQKQLAEGKTISELAGQFRTEYMDVSELMLHGVGMRAFSGAAYDGQTIYFVEEKSGKFYTYTIVVPNIYEKSGKRSHMATPVPWELPCTILQMQQAKIRLRQGKANAERRLSSTTQAKAELMEVGGSLPDNVANLIFDDFELLWEEYARRVEASAASGTIGEAGELPEAEKLFLLRPRKLLDMHYDETNQRLVFYLEDISGHRLRGQLSYSKEEATAIKSLERMEKKLQQEGSELPVFVGTLYVQDGECTLYPIETIKEERLK